MMYPAIFSRTYPMKRVEEVLAAIRGDGYLGAQMNLSSFGLDSLPESLDVAQLERGRAIAAHSGLILSALSGTYNMALPAVREFGRPRFQRVVEAARTIGAPVVTLCTGSRNAENMWHHHPENATPHAWADLTAELEFALGVAEQFEVLLAIEPEPGNVICDAHAARRILDQFKSPRLKIVLDAANLLSPGALGQQRRIMDYAIDLLGPDILLAHAKDMTVAGDVVAPGEGAVDLDYFATCLRATGFDGALIGHGFEAKDSGIAAAKLRQLCGMSA